MIKYPIVRIEYYHIEFEPEWLKATPGFEHIKYPIFRRQVLKEKWENLIGNKWIKVLNSRQLENWFKKQNI